MNTGAISNYRQAIESASSSANSSAAQATGAASVSKDEFLQLLVAQLKNQDPMDPVKNEDFLAQLATFSSLEQLVAIKDGVNLLAGISTDGTQNTTDSSTQN